MVKGKSLETQLDKLCERINAMGYHAHKNHPNRTADGKRLTGEPFDYEILMPDYHACFDAKECHDSAWHMQKKDILQAEHLKHCKNAGCDAFFLIFFFDERKLLKFDVDKVIGVLASGSKTVHKELGEQYSLTILT